jgi:hypothetical protein
LPLGTFACEPLRLLAAGAVVRSILAAHVAKGNQPPAEDIALRDVIEHMNHKFGLIDANFDALDGKMSKGFHSLAQRMERGSAEAKRERAEIFRRVEAEASAADDTLEKVVALTGRVDIIEKYLALSKAKRRSRVLLNSPQPLLRYTVQGSARMR